MKLSDHYDGVWTLLLEELMIWNSQTEFFLLHETFVELETANYNIQPKTDLVLE